VSAWNRTVAWTPGLALLCIIVCGGCKSDPSSPGANRDETESDTETADVVPLAVSDEQAYFVCPDGEADTVLVVDIVIPEVIGREHYAFPLKRDRVYDEQGRLILRHKYPYGGHACRDSFEPRSWCNGGVDVKQGKDDDITIAIDFDWMKTSGEKGSLHEALTIPVGSPQEQSLSHGTTVKAFFQEPWPKPVPENIPFFIGQLDGEDWDRADTQLLRIGKPAIPAMVELLKTGNERQGYKAAWWLGAVPEYTQIATPALIEAMQNSPSPHVRYGAVQAFYRAGPPPEAIPAIRRALTDPDESVRRCAQEAIDKAEGRGKYAPSQDTPDPE